MSSIPDALQNAKDDLEQGKRVSISARELLRWFNAERRSQWLVTYIRAALRNVGITTEPDFEGVNIDATLSLRLAPEPATETESAIPQPGIAASSDLPIDPTLRIRILKAAITKPLTVPYEAQLSTAITAMVSNDYSQLPVLKGQHLRGAVSWKSIGKRLGLGATATAVRECIQPALELPLDAPLLGAIDQIVDQDFALIRDSAGRLCGIVTTADLSTEFRVLSEPFLLLREAENYIRSLLDNKLSTEELSALRDPNIARTISTSSDLTFGEYVRALERPEIWQRLGLHLDRKAVRGALERVRLLRNDVMHFDPDPIEESRLSDLRNFVRLLQTLAECRIVMIGDQPYGTA